MNITLADRAILAGAVAAALLDIKNQGRKFNPEEQAAAVRIAAWAKEQVHADEELRQSKTVPALIALGDRLIEGENTQ